MKAVSSLFKAITVYAILLVYTVFTVIMSVIVQTCSALLLLVIFPVLGVIESFSIEADAWETAQMCIDELNSGGFNG